jgi:hypothetical protein
MLTTSGWITQSMAETSALRSRTGTVETQAGIGKKTLPRGTRTCHLATAGWSQPKWVVALVEVSSTPHVPGALCPIHTNPFCAHRAAFRAAGHQLQDYERFR